jgi:fructose-1,6-bisphosphatase II / sedoheptulose-1,7-bisphosphatase
MSSRPTLESLLALDALRITEAAALACAPWRGRGDSIAADQAAVDSMRELLAALPMRGRIVIGEGERDKAPMLYIGETLGTGTDHTVDIAVDPLEGTTLCAHQAPGALTVLAMAREGGLLHAPDLYMDKIAVGAGLPEHVVGLDFPAARNINQLAEAKGCRPDDLTVMLLDRPRHHALIAAYRATEARIQLIPDGDIAAVIAAASDDLPVDLYVGTGGAPEGVLAAAALHCIGGQMQTRLCITNDDERSRAIEALCAELAETTGCTHVDAHAVAQGVEAMADGLWLSMMLYPAWVGPEAARARVLEWLSGHFPSHFAGSPHAGEQS